MADFGDAVQVDVPELAVESDNDDAADLAAEAHQAIRTLADLDLDRRGGIDNIDNVGGADAVALGVGATLGSQTGSMNTTTSYNAVLRLRSSMRN